MRNDFEPVLSTSAMREADATTIETLGIPGRVLMEVAGRAAVDAIERRYGSPAGKRVLVVCGRGNNGGDGLVVARVLHGRGASVRVLVSARDSDLSQDAAANLQALRHIADREDDLAIVTETDASGENTWWPQLVVDALLGIGTSGELREPISSLARLINRCEAPCVALDVPSGLDSDTGAAAGEAVSADLTVAMGALKPGLLLAKGPAHTGEIEVADIGIPRFLLQDGARQPGSAWVSTDSGVAALLPPRSRNAHKYSAGRALVVAGSVQYPGAPVMTSTAAARAGAGAVTVAVPAGARETVAAHLIEVMSVPLDGTAEGTLAGSAFEELRQRGEQADAVAIGPGMGRNAETASLIRRLLPVLSTPIVIDADGLNALAGHLDLIRDNSQGRWVITPHLGELRRLLDDANLQPEQPARLAADLASRLSCVVVLKGSPSVVGTPDGHAIISAPTTPALATAGTGDVLAGVICAFLAQSLAPPDAAIAALHVTGLAAERFAASGAARTMLATDLLSELPFVLTA